jgi:hypothetical protein
MKKGEFGKSPIEEMQDFLIRPTIPLIGFVIGHELYWEQ